MTTYHLLGRTGLRVSPLALGVMTFGQDEWGADEQTSRTIFTRYLESGGNFVDTANMYAGGRSEELTGKFIEETGTRDRVVLATKFTNPIDPGNPNGFGNGRKNIMASLEGSLRRLRTDYVDLYWLHAWDQMTPVDEVLATLDALVRDGKVRAIGLSNVPAWYATKAQALAHTRGWESVAALQMEYSLVQREIEREHIPAALEFGMAIVPWSPLAHGFLAGKYRRDGADYSGPGRLDTEQFKQLRGVMGPGREQDWAVLDTLVEIAEELGRPTAQVALNWVAQRPGVVSTLIGARTVEQLDTNLAALDFELSDKQRARLDEVSAPEQLYPWLMFESDVLERFLTPGFRVQAEPAWFRR